jgi:hypothetical protein
MNMDKYFYFFDINEVLIDRYPAKIAKDLSNNFGIKNFIFIYSEKYDYGEPKNLPDGGKSFYIKNITKKKIENLFLSFPPYSLTTIAQRIPDMLMISIFNINNLPTFTVQHGLWSDSIVRLAVIPQIISKFSKFKVFGRYAFEICKIHKFPFFSTLLEMYKFFYVDKSSIKATKYLKSDDLRPKKVFAFDKSWDNYYINKFGYSKKDIIYIGNPDFLAIKEKDITQKEDAVCYICQSLVEDGRYLLSDYQDFLKVLKQTIVGKKKLYMKLHPRSRMENYKILEECDDVVFLNEFPICDFYIGHYTSLLAVSEQVSKNILIWELKGHYTPEYFKEFGSVITDNPLDITKFINYKYKSENSKSTEIISNEYLKVFNPIGTISKNIISLSK